jgi:DNA end-binding protein Ku
MSARSIGSATIAFGLVSIPVKVYASTDSGSAISFHQINPATGARVRQRLVDGSTGEDVAYGDLVKGYEVGADQYVIFTKEELESAAAEATRAIDIEEFVPIATVDPIFFDTPYYLGPGQGGDRSYALLRQALLDTGLGAIGQYAARGRQQIVMLRADETGIVMQRLHYADEVRDWSDIPLGGEVTIKAAELDLAKKIVEMSTAKAFDPTRYDDEVRKKLLEMIAAKQDGKVISAPSEDSPQGQVIDLMEALKKSLEARKGGAKSKLAAVPSAADPADAAADDKPAKAASEGTSSAKKALAKKVSTPKKKAS